MACSLLETCGRFLYRSPETTVRMANMLDVMMRLKIIKNLDPRHSTLVENAYYLCKPPEKSARVSKVRPPLHQVSHFYCYTSFLKLSYAYLYTEDDWCLECKHAYLTWRVFLLHGILFMSSMLYLMEIILMQNTAVKCPWGWLGVFV